MAQNKVLTLAQAWTWLRRQGEDLRASPPSGMSSKKDCAGSSSCLDQRTRPHSILAAFWWKNSKKVSTPESDFDCGSVEDAGNDLDKEVMHSFWKPYLLLECLFLDDGFNEGNEETRREVLR